MVEKKDEGKEKIRIFLAVALIKVNFFLIFLCTFFFFFFFLQICKKFPVEFFNLEFPKIIQGVCVCLKNKNIEVRENARKVLIEIMKIMGPYFLQFIINEMQFVLKESPLFY